MDEDGCVRVTGRAKDLIIRGGVNISPAEVDNILLQIPTVAEAATIGVPDKIYGEEVVCYVAPKEGETLTTETVLGPLQHQTARIPDAEADHHLRMNYPRPNAAR